jgi:hypothetical protein
MNLLANLRHLRLSHVLFTVLVAAILLYLIIPVLIVCPFQHPETAASKRLLAQRVRASPIPLSMKGRKM